MNRPTHDPFGEFCKRDLHTRLHVLGGTLRVEATNSALLELAEKSFGGLPKHNLGGTQQDLRMRIVLSHHKENWPATGNPPEPKMHSGAGLISATIDAGNLAIIDPEHSRALVCVSPRMLRHPYLARTELIDLAVLTLTSRSLGLVPLHAACVGINGAGALIVGAGGAGKSTISLLAMTAGMQYLSEDGAFVSLDRLLVTGVSKYLYVTPDTLPFIHTKELRDYIRKSPMIRRKSGVCKLEVDLQKIPAHVSKTALRLASIVILSRRTATKTPALRRLDSQSLLRRLRKEQPYAVGLPHWSKFERSISELPAYELRRTRDPEYSVRKLQDILSV